MRKSIIRERTWKAKQQVKKIFEFEHAHSIHIMVIIQLNKILFFLPYIYLFLSFFEKDKEKNERHLFLEE